MTQNRIRVHLCSSAALIAFLLSPALQAEDGKKWIYRKTPFGAVWIEDKPQQLKPEDYANIKATEHGDTIRFERPGPFGTYKWERKKTELNETEQAAWSRRTHVEQRP